MKKLKSVLVAVISVAIMFSLAACAGTATPDPVEPPYVPVAGVYTHHEIADWVSSAAPGKAAKDGDHVKITTAGTTYGGVKSPSNSKAITVDYSKPTYLTFKDLTVSSGTTLLLKASVVGYSQIDSSYVMSDDFIGVTGDFSINLQDAFYRYASAATNGELIYKVGDVDLDGALGTELIAENDARVGKLKFQNKTTPIKTVIELMVMRPDNSSHKDSFVKFKSMAITSEAAKTITSVSLNQSDLTDENAKEKDSASITLAPVFEKTASASDKIVYISSNADAVPVTDAGVVSFKKVTSSNVVVKAIARGDITKSSSFAVGVISNIKTAAQVKTHFDEMSFVSDKVATDIPTKDIIAGTILSKQNATADSAAYKALKLYNNKNVLTILNSYDKANAEMLSEKTLNNGKFKATVSLAKGEKTWTNATLSIYDVADDNITRLVSAVVVAEANSAFTYEFGINYAEENKIAHNSTLVVLWSNGTELEANRVEVARKDANKFGADYVGDSLEGKLSNHNTANGAITFNANKQLELKLAATSSIINAYMPNVDLVPSIAGKDLYIVIDVASLDSKFYINFVVGGQYLFTDQLTRSDGQGLLVLNFTKAMAEKNVVATNDMQINIDFILNPYVATGNQETVVINSIRFFC